MVLLSDYVVLVRDFTLQLRVCGLKILVRLLFGRIRGLRVVALRCKRGLRLRILGVLLVNYAVVIDDEQRGCSSADQDVSGAGSTVSLNRARRGKPDEQRGRQYRRDSFLHNGHLVCTSTLYQRHWYTRRCPSVISAVQRPKGVTPITMHSSDVPPCGRDSSGGDYMPRRMSEDNATYLLKLGKAKSHISSIVRVAACRIPP